ncbi:MAG: hypothetical protein VR68_11885 [Peptococcaceae bacterium BRH_c4a]|nr:MAG: hypothetical protein VR68_11885 [Peptococcaceae bacterium BRH_c4a]
MWELARQGEGRVILDKFTQEEIKAAYKKICANHNLSVPGMAPGWCYVIKSCRDRLVGLD